jgi:hypothetical protein
MPQSGWIRRWKGAGSLKLSDEARRWLSQALAGFLLLILAAAFLIAAWFGLRWAFGPEPCPAYDPMCHADEPQPLP